MTLAGQDVEVVGETSEVLRKLRDIDPDAVRGSLAHLERLGLLDRAGARFRASDGLRHIDRLDLIAI